METTFLQEAGILITNKRAVFGTQTFALSNLSSFEAKVTDVTPDNTGSIVGAFMGFLIFAGMGIAFYVTIRNWYGTAICGLLAAMMFWFFIMTLKPLPKRYWYEIMVTSSSTQSRLFGTYDKAQFDRVHMALTAAVVARL